jgi:hypothetical protein
MDFLLWDGLFAEEFKEVFNGGSVVGSLLIDAVDNQVIAVVCIDSENHLFASDSISSGSDFVDSHFCVPLSLS